MAEEVKNIAVELLQSNPLQPRGAILPESLRELTDSIKVHGILEPLVVAHTPAGYQIIAGERRWRAAKLAGLAIVPCVIRESSHREMLEMALVENVQREDLNAIERAGAFSRLQLEFGLATSEIAERLGKSASYVSNTLRLLSLPDALKDALINGDVTEGHLRALAAIDETTAQIEALKMILSSSGTVRMAEQLAREYQEKHPKTESKVREERINVEENRIMEREWKNLLNASRVKVSQSRQRATITLVIKGGYEKTSEMVRRVNRILKEEFGAS